VLQIAKEKREVYLSKISR